MKDNSFDYYMEEVCRIPLLSPEEEKNLGKLAFEGDEAARNKLVKANLRFVVQTANKFRNCGLEMEDIISEGNNGLIIAAEKFNPEKNVRFISYAVWWINQTIRKAIYTQSKNVRIPVGRNDLLNASEWNMASLDKAVDEKEGSASVCDLIQDKMFRLPEEELLLKEAARDVSDVMECLNDLEKNVVSMRNGINGKKCCSLTEIGNHLGYSKERIRQIEMKALGKLRSEIKEYGYVA